MRILLLATTLWVACDGTHDTSTPSTEGDCEACLASGGTWQPEASACTEDCALMARARDENAVIVAQITPFFDDE